MKAAHLFAGIRGFSEAFRRAGVESVFSVEIDDKCNECGKRHFRNEEVHADD